MAVRIGVWIEDIDLTAGGGASYQNLFVHRIASYEFSDKLEIVLLNVNSRIGELLANKKETINIRVRLSFAHKLRIRFAKFVSRVLRVTDSSHVKVRREIVARCIDEVLAENCIDVVFYPSQLMVRTLSTPFIATNWDLGHLSMYAFPEVSEEKEFRKRARHYEILSRALGIFAESESGKQELTSFLRLNPNRIFVVPIFPGGVVNVAVDRGDQMKILRQLGLASKTFFFYPAQFWPHKNHYNLLKAFKEVSADHSDFKLVLTGADKGNFAYITEIVKQLDLNENVVFAGFVDDVVLSTLYSNATALVMPTFLGPTNMPLLEAMYFECLIICSDFQGHREMLGDAAIYVSPDNPAEIAEAMLQSLDHGFTYQRIELLKQRRSNSIFNIESAMVRLNEHLVRVANIRSTWKVSKHG